MFTSHKHEQTPFIKSSLFMILGLPIRETEREEYPEVFMFDKEKRHWHHMSIMASKQDRTGYR